MAAKKLGVKKVAGKKATAKKTASYKKLTIKGGGGSQNDIALYAGPKVHSSFKTIAQQVDTFDGIHHLSVLLEAALEEGKRLGRAEMMPKIRDMHSQLGEVVAGIEKETLHRKPGRPKKSAGR